MNTLFSLSARLASGEITPEELIRDTLDAIHARGAETNAFLETWDEEALRLAAESTARRAAGAPLSPWDGIPFGVKDNFLYKGHAAACVSRALEGFTAPYTAAAVKRLTNAGLIPVGRLNMDEFAMGSRGENSRFGAVRNPLDPARSAGGSSSGSAAAVAAGLVPFALGSDTGGSIRLPAAFCGVTGVKPAYGTVSRWGLVAFASSLDCVSLAAACPADCVPLMDLLAGEDGLDSTEDASLWQKNHFGEKPRVGVISLPEGCEIAPAWEKTLRLLKEGGAELIPVSMPGGEAALAAYLLISSAEASSNLARYDGIRYGHRPAESAGTAAEQYRAARGEGFGQEVKRRLMMGVHALTEDGLYEKADWIRENVKAEFDDIFRACDFLLSPAAFSFPPLLGADAEDPGAVYRGDVLTVPASLAGLPSVCVPVCDGGFPAGICMTGPRDSLHALLLAATRYFSPATGGSVL